LSGLSKGFVNSDRSRQAMLTWKVMLARLSSYDKLILPHVIVLSAVFKVAGTLYFRGPSSKMHKKSLRNSWNHFLCSATANDLIEYFSYKFIYHQVQSTNRNLPFGSRRNINLRLVSNHWQDSGAFFRSLVQVTSVQFPHWNPGHNRLTRWTGVLWGTSSTFYAPVAWENWRSTIGAWWIGGAVVKCEIGWREIRTVVDLHRYGTLEVT